MQARLKLESSTHLSRLLAIIDVPLFHQSSPGLAGDHSFFWSVCGRSSVTCNRTCDMLRAGSEPRRDASASRRRQRSALLSAAAFGVSSGGR